MKIQIAVLAATDFCDACSRFGILDAHHLSVAVPYVLASRPALVHPWILHQCVILFKLCQASPFCFIKIPTEFACYCSTK